MRYSAINKSSTNAGSGTMMAPVMVTAATFDQKQQIQKHVSPIEKVEDGENFIDVVYAKNEISVEISKSYYYITNCCMRYL